MQLKLLSVISSKVTFGPSNGLCVVFFKFERASQFAVFFVKYVEIKNNRRNGDRCNRNNRIDFIPGWLFYLNDSFDTPPKLCHIGPEAYALHSLPG